MSPLDSLCHVCPCLGQSAEMLTLWDRLLQGSTTCRIASCSTIPAQIPICFSPEGHGKHKTKSPGLISAEGNTYFLKSGPRMM